MSWEEDIDGRLRSRNSEGEVVTCIELATKILDRDGVYTFHCGLTQNIGEMLTTSPSERIRYTLAHEMCHLATWIIDKDLASNHDKLFWKW